MRVAVGGEVLHIVVDSGLCIGFFVGQRDVTIGDDIKNLVDGHDVDGLLGPYRAKAGKSGNEGENLFHNHVMF